MNLYKNINFYKTIYFPIKRHSLKEFSNSELKNSFNKNLNVSFQNSNSTYENKNLHFANQITPSPNQTNKILKNFRKSSSNIKSPINPYNTPNEFLENTNFDPDIKNIASFTIQLSNGSTVVKNKQKINQNLITNSENKFTKFNKTCEIKFSMQSQNSQNNTYSGKMLEKYKRRHSQQKQINKTVKKL